jgi:3-hydroxyisobutyrate dehydrogenase-like beta-hydroxyacid dehydrogenase
MSIAGSLLAGGRTVVGFRRSDAEEFRQQGGHLLSSPREVLEASAVVFTALTDETALLSAVDGTGGFLSGNASGRTVIDLSTTALPPRLAVRERLRHAGAAMIDCPVSGLPSMVRQRKGVFLASADATEFAAVEPYLRLVSDEVYYVGAFGNGTKLKYLANFLMVVHAAAAAETIAVARAAGLDPALAVQVLSRRRPQSISSPRTSARSANSSARSDSTAPCFMPPSRWWSAREASVSARLIQPRWSRRRRRTSQWHHKTTISPRQRGLPDDGQCREAWLRGSSCRRPRQHEAPLS